MPRTPHPALDYIRTLYAPEDTLLARIRAALTDLNRGWQIGAEEGRLLQMLMRLHGAKRVVEVGTLLGYSAIWMARALPEGGHIITLEKDADHARLARGFIAESDVAERITLMEGDANTNLGTLSTEAPFDMLFIDADKPGYNAYLDWAEQNIRQGGLIVADNTLLFGAAWQEKAPEGTAPSTHAAMRRFNARLADRRKYDATMIPTEEGLTVAVKLF